MPKLPHASGLEVLRALERPGFHKGAPERQPRHHETRVQGLRRADAHAELKIGTLAGVLRQAEVSPEELIQGLRG
jgi:predicted RNA binding protein YcfA (HicA-like mRNA interferase family)